MPDSRRKGAAGELEVAKLLGAVKISRQYLPGPDLQMPDGRYVEVKRLADGWKRIYKWLDDDAQILAMKADHKPWLITMHLSTYLDIIEELK